MTHCTTRSGRVLVGALAAVLAVGCFSIVASRTVAQQGAAAAPRAAQTWAPGGKRERLNAQNCVFAFVDHQTGLMSLVHNATPTQFKNDVLALGQAAKLHAVPVVFTTSAETGPNGPLMPELRALHPDAPLISRPGQISAWDNADFVAAIERTGRKKIIVSGITTDVCVVFATLAALDAGYEVHVVVDASGTMSSDVQTAAIMRMSAAGAEITNWFAVACELLQDWRQPTGPGSAELFVDHLPSYAEVFHSHKAASGR